MRTVEDKKKRLLLTGAIFILFAAGISTLANFSSFLQNSPLSFLTCCTELEKEGLYMIASILILMGGYCLLSGLKL